MGVKRQYKRVCTISIRTTGQNFLSTPSEQVLQKGGEETEKFKMCEESQVTIRLEQYSERYWSSHWI